MTSFEFKGTGFEYFKIWIVNILFTALTLGIYHPWAKVRNNRYLYANSTVDEKNFDYHATGKQLFYGYIIAVFFFLFYKLVSAFFPIGGIILVIFFLFIIPWLILRSMKFNLNVTSFNNIRFKFSGGIKESYIIFLAIPIVSFIIFGLIIFLIVQLKSSIITIIGILLALGLYIIATSYFNVVKTRFLIEYTSYGRSSFETKISTPEFIKIMVKAMLVSISVFLLGAIIIASIFYLVSDISEVTSLLKMYTTDPKLAITMMFTSFAFVFASLYFITIAASLISFAYYITRQRAYIFKNTNLDSEVRFFSTMKFIPYAGILITNFLLIIITLGLAYPWAKVRVAKYTLANTTLKQDSNFNGYLNKIEKKESAFGEQVSDTFDVGIDIPI